MSFVENQLNKDLNRLKRHNGGGRDSHKAEMARQQLYKIRSILDKNLSDLDAGQAPSMSLSDDDLNFFRGILVKMQSHEIEETSMDENSLILSPLSGFQAPERRVNQFRVGNEEEENKGRRGGSEGGAAAHKRNYQHYVNLAYQNEGERGMEGRRNDHPEQLDLRLVKYQAGSGDVQEDDEEEDGRSSTPLRNTRLRTAIIGGEEYVKIEDLRMQLKQQGGSGINKLMAPNGPKSRINEVRPEQYREMIKGPHLKAGTFKGLMKKRRLKRVSSRSRHPHPNDSYQIEKGIAKRIKKRAAMLKSSINGNHTHQDTLVEMTKGSYHHYGRTGERIPRKALSKGYLLGNGDGKAIANEEAYYENLVQAIEKRHNRRPSATRRGGRQSRTKGKRKSSANQGNNGRRKAGSRKKRSRARKGASRSRSRKKKVKYNVTNKLMPSDSQILTNVPERMKMFEKITEKSRNKSVKAILNEVVGKSRAVCPADRDRVLARRTQNRSRSKKSRFSSSKKKAYSRDFDVFDEGGYPLRDGDRVYEEDLERLSSRMDANRVIIHEMETWGKKQRSRSKGIDTDFEGSFGVVRNQNQEDTLLTDNFSTSIKKCLYPSNLKTRVNSKTDSKGNQAVGGVVEKQYAKKIEKKRFLENFSDLTSEANMREISMNRARDQRSGSRTPRGGSSSRKSTRRKSSYKKKKNEQGVDENHPKSSNRVRNQANQAKYRQESAAMKENRPHITNMHQTQDQPSHAPLGDDLYNAPLAKLTLTSSEFKGGLQDTQKIADNYIYKRDDFWAPDPKIDFKNPALTPPYEVINQRVIGIKPSKQKRRFSKNGKKGSKDDSEQKGGSKALNKTLGGNPTRVLKSAYQKYSRMVNETDKGKTKGRGKKRKRSKKGSKARLKNLRLNNQTNKANPLFSIVYENDDSVKNFINNLAAEYLNHEGDDLRERYELDRPDFDPEGEMRPVYKKSKKRGKRGSKGGKGNNKRKSSMKRLKGRKGSRKKRSLNKKKNFLDQDSDDEEDEDLISSVTTPLDGGENDRKNGQNDDNFGSKKSHSIGGEMVDLQNNRRSVGVSTDLLLNSDLKTALEMLQNEDLNPISKTAENQKNSKNGKKSGSKKTKEEQKATQIDNKTLKQSPKEAKSLPKPPTPKKTNKHTPVDTITSKGSVYTPTDQLTLSRMSPKIPHANNPTSSESASKDNMVAFKLPEGRRLSEFVPEPLPEPINPSGSRSSRGNKSKRKRNSVLIQMISNQENRFKEMKSLTNRSFRKSILADFSRRAAGMTTCSNRVGAGLLSLGPVEEVDLQDGEEGKPGPLPSMLLSGFDHITTPMLSYISNLLVFEDVDPVSVNIEPIDAITVDFEGGGCSRRENINQILQKPIYGIKSPNLESEGVSTNTINFSVSGIAMKQMEHDGSLGTEQDDWLLRRMISEGQNRFKGLKTSQQSSKQAGSHGALIQPRLGQKRGIEPQSKIGIFRSADDPIGEENDPRDDLRDLDDDPHQRMADLLEDSPDTNQKNVEQNQGVEEEGNENQQGELQHSGQGQRLDRSVTITETLKDRFGRIVVEHSGGQYLDDNILPIDE